MSHAVNILIVDDQSIHRDLLAAILAKWPEYHVITVENGQTALELLKGPGPRFDLVFLDVRMPGLSGLDLLEQLRDSPLHRSLQFIMCTSLNDRPTITKAFELGAKHYIVKPCSEDGIAQKLRQIGALPASVSN